MLRARIAANESSAASGIRTINTALVSFNSNYPTTGYVATLPDLGDPADQCPATAPSSTNACLIDNNLATNGAGKGKSGYNYKYVPKAGAAGNFVDYAVSADPVSPNQTGVRSFCSFSDAVVRVQIGALGGACPNTTPPLQ